MGEPARRRHSDFAGQGRPLFAPETALAGNRSSPLRSSAHHPGGRTQRDEQAVKAVGLYDPAYEHDACGVAFVARLDGEPTHETVVRALTALANLEHRGAAGADAEHAATAPASCSSCRTRSSAASSAPQLPPPGQLRRRGLLPAARRRRAPRARAAARARRSRPRGSSVLGWRDVPVDARSRARRAAGVAPLIRQLFVARGDLASTSDAFERKLYVIRRVAELAAGAGPRRSRASRRARSSTRGC